MNQNTIDALRRNSLFMSVPDVNLKQLESDIEERQYDEDQYIFQQGEEDDNLFLVKSGKVGIFSQTAGGKPVLLGEIHPDDYFGEMELLDGLPRSADAKALTDVEVICIRYKAFKALLKKDMQIASNVTQQLCFRLRKTNQLISDSFEYKGEYAKSRFNRMTRLIEASKLVNSSLDLDSILEIILDTAIQATDADRGTLYLVDESANEIWSKLLLGRKMKEIRLPMGKGIAGYVARTGETVSTEDVYSHPCFNREIDVRSGYQTKNMLCIPMRNNRGTVIGVFQLLNKNAGSFDQDDEDFIDALSSHASIAIENARLHKNIVNNERLTAVGRMANTIIHDLRNPMNTIKSYTKRLQMESVSADSIEIADEVIRQADRLINMVQEILDFSKGSMEVKKSEVNVEQMIMTMFKFIEKDFKEKNIIIDTDLKYTSGWKMDADKMIRVLFNITGNAADAMKSGGKLTITTGIENDMLKLTITDTGAGMNPQTVSRIFEPFYTHGKKYGTGLGLSIVQRIIDNHKGKITVESEEGRGTMLIIYLPAN